MKEAILYIFKKGSVILIEHRLQDEEGELGIMAPGGGIDEKDHGEGRDYKEVAMLREVQEELNGQVIIHDYIYVGYIIRTKTGTPFHVFLITKWEGEAPAYIMEDGKKDGRLEWMDIDEVLAKTKNQVTIDGLKKVEEYSKS